MNIVLGLAALLTAFGLLLTLTVWLTGESYRQAVLALLAVIFLMAVGVLILGLIVFGYWQLSG